MSDLAPEGGMKSGGEMADLALRGNARPDIGGLCALQQWQRGHASGHERGR